MTAYLAIIGSIPTVYLWIVKERKKEEELKNKQQEINQITISELNKVYVDAVNQFFDDKTFIAGAYLYFQHKRIIMRINYSPASLMNYYKK